MAGNNGDANSVPVTASQLREFKQQLDAQQSEIIRLKDRANFLSFVDDILLAVQRWEQFCKSIEKEYNAAFRGHQTALSKSKKDYLVAEQARDQWKRTMLTVVMFGINSFSGGVAGKLFGQLLVAKLPADVLAVSSRLQRGVSGVEVFGEDLAKAGLAELSSDFTPSKSGAADLFDALAPEDAAESLELRFLDAFAVGTNKLIADVQTLKRKVESNLIDATAIGSNVANLRKSEFLLTSPPLVSQVQGLRRAALERTMWLLWVLQLDKPYWERVRILVKLDPASREQWEKNRVGTFGVTRIESYYEDLVSFEKIRDEMLSSGAFSPSECTCTSLWQPTDVAKRAFPYRSVLFANVIDIALRELPMSLVPAKYLSNAAAARLASEQCVVPRVAQTPKMSRFPGDGAYR